MPNMIDAYAFDIQTTFQPASLFSDFGQLFSDIIVVLISLTGALSIIFIVIGGIKIVTASGDPKKLDAARSQITYAIIGIVVTALVFVILRVVQYMLKSEIPGLP